MKEREEEINSEIPVNIQVGMFEVLIIIFIIIIYDKL